MSFLLEVKDLHVSFPVSGRGKVMTAAVDGVSFEIGRGEVVGLVGESGCGKTTLGRAIASLQKVDSGEVVLEGESLQKMNGADLRKFRRRMQMIFQNPYSSLNPRMTVMDILSEPMRFCRGLRFRDCAGPVAEIMEQVGLDPGMIRKFPHEFSGGQRQRIAIARALCAKPSLVIADEPVSSLDVSISAQILSLLASLRDSMGLTMLFISHDLSVVKYISHRVAVMYRGALVEVADVKELYDNPLHPYTRVLLSAVPVPDPARKSFLSVSAPPSPEGCANNEGCFFRSRCKGSVEKCARCRPTLSSVDKHGKHLVSCWRAIEEK